MIQKNITLPKLKIIILTFFLIALFHLALSASRHNLDSLKTFEKAWETLLKTQKTAWNASTLFLNSSVAISGDDGKTERPKLGPKFSEGPCLPSNNGYTMPGKRDFKRWKEEDILKARQEWKDFMELEVPNKYLTYNEAVKVLEIKGLQTANRGIVITMMKEQVVWIVASIRILRQLGCFLPIEIWTFSGDMTKETMAPILNLSRTDSPITFREGDDLRNYIPIPRGGGNGYHVKISAVINSDFENLLFLDSDTFALKNPEFLFDSDEFKNEGDLFWVDYWKTHTNNPVWKWMDLPCVDEWEQESGMMVINRRRAWKALHLLYFISRNTESRNFHSFLHGDKDLFRFTWRKTSTPYYFIPDYLSQIGIMTSNAKKQKVLCGMGMVQVDFAGKPLFAHINVFKRWPKDKITKQERGSPFFVQQYVTLSNLTLENWPAGPVPGTLLKWANTRGARVSYNQFRNHRCIDLKSNVNNEGVIRTKEQIPLEKFNLNSTFSKEFWEVFIPQYLGN
ncbi:hypothetical protein HK098_002678 [Nowakowskiella sp. JEL0407]|nr:hypothetical protein HK098_002678 [Nowakowskiella sp. JEL0407]